MMSKNDENLSGTFFFVTLQPNDCCNQDDDMPIKIDALIDDKFGGIHQKYTRLPCPNCRKIGVFKTGQWIGKYCTEKEVPEEFSKAKDYTVFELQARIERDEHKFASALKRTVDICESLVDIKTAMSQYETQGEIF